MLRSGGRFDLTGFQALGGGDQETATAEPVATKKSARDALLDDIAFYEEPTKVGVDPLAQEKGRAEQEKKVSVARPPGQVRRAENVSKPMSISEKEAMEEELNANYSASKVRCGTLFSCHSVFPVLLCLLS